MSYGIGSFTLEIIDYQPPNCVVFEGSPLFYGTIPNFTIEFKTVPEGTWLHYIAHPIIPPLVKPLMTILGPPWGKYDLARYFRQFKTMMASYSK